MVRNRDWRANGVNQPSTEVKHIEQNKKCSTSQVIHGYRMHSHLAGGSGQTSSTDGELAQHDAEGGVRGVSTTNANKHSIVNTPTATNWRNYLVQYRSAPSQPRRSGPRQLVDVTYSRCIAPEYSTDQLAARQLPERLVPHRCLVLNGQEPTKPSWRLNRPQVYKYCWIAGGRTYTLIGLSTKRIELAAQ